MGMQRIKMLAHNRAFMYAFAITLAVLDRKSVV